MSNRLKLRLSSPTTGWWKRLTPASWKRTSCASVPVVPGTKRDSACTPVWNDGDWRGRVCLSEGRRVPSHWHWGCPGRQAVDKVDRQRLPRLAEQWLEEAGAGGAADRDSRAAECARRRPRSRRAL